VNYCGLDVAGVSSYAYVSDGRGRKVWSGPVETSEEELKQRLGLYLRGGLRVAVEAGNQTAWIHDVLVELGARVTVVNPKRVKAIAESRRKTDKVDAKVLCDLLRMDGLPHPVHMPGQETRELRGLLAARRQVVGMRTKLCNVVRGLLRQEGVSLPARALKSQVGWRRLLGGGYRHGHVPVVLGAAYPSFQALSKTLDELDKQLAEREARDKRVKRLQSMPRVGRIASLTFVAAVDRVKRFSSSRKVVSYSGLVPSVRASGERVEYGSITREGRSELRAVWVQIAHLVAHDTSPEARPLRRWFGRVARRRGKKTATVALARKLLTIAYQMLKHDVDYDPARLGRAA
jgi:transposase